MNHNHAFGRFLGLRTTILTATTTLKWTTFTTFLFLNMTITSMNIHHTRKTTATTRIIGNSSHQPRLPQARKQPNKLKYQEPETHRTTTNLRTVFVVFIAPIRLVCIINLLHYCCPYILLQYKPDCFSKKQVSVAKHIVYLFLFIQYKLFCSLQLN